MKIKEDVKKNFKKNLSALFTWLVLGMFFGIGSAIGVMMILNIYIG